MIIKEQKDKLKEIAKRTDNESLKKDIKDKLTNKEVKK
jgi:hypothetical protein